MKIYAKPWILTVLATGMLSAALAEIPLDSTQVQTDSTQVSGPAVIIQNALNAEGEMREGSLWIQYPRTDVTVMVDGQALPPGMGLTSWCAWKTVSDSQSLLAGDFALLEEEVNPFISELEGSRISVTSLDNHFLRDQPHVMFLHIQGNGNSDSMANTLRRALDLTAIPRPPLFPPDSTALALDTQAISNILGYPGKFENGAFKVILERSGVQHAGVEMPFGMGAQSWAGFMGTDETAYLTGAVAMARGEVDSVLAILSKSGIEIAGLQTRMLEENPRVLFVYYWGTGPAQELAQALKQVFDVVKEPVPPLAESRSRK